MGVAVEALAKARLKPRDVAAIGITNQRETTVLWDRQTGEAIHHAIVWQDRRTAPMCDKLRAPPATKPCFQKRTGLILDAYFSGTKLRWLLDHIPGARNRAEARRLAFGTIDTWLLWKLTGRLHVTDPSNASRTLLYNIHTGEWDKELLDPAAHPESFLPEVRSSSEVYGESRTRPGSPAIPVSGIAGDQQAALFGQMCIQPGLTKNTYGTGCFMLHEHRHKAVASKNRLLTTVAWKIGNKTEYALEGSVFIGGAVVQWLRDGLGIIESSNDVETLAAGVADNGGITLIPAFAGLGAPWWRPDARAALVGMTRGTTRAHIARASLEAIALQSADLLLAMEQDSGVRLTELRVDGGAARNNLLMQVQADLLGVPVVRPQVTETTALGAAYLAGLAVGFWKSAEDCAEHWKTERRFEPSISESERRERLQQWQHEVKRVIG
jgi:glycerol kinase